MLGIYFDDGLKLRDDLPDPEPGPGEALIKVMAAGICHTDLEIVRGYMHFRGIMGHEFVGVVEAADDPELVGKRVVGEINCWCGLCPLCIEGKTSHCAQRTTLGISGRDGVFAEYVALPVANLHVVPDTMPLYSAVFVEPLAACFRILEQVHINPKLGVAVLGDGKLGLLAAQVLRLTGCRLLAIGNYPHKLKILDRLGVRTALQKEIDGGERFDVVVECTGRPEGFELARSLVDPGGTIVQKSTYVESLNVDISRLVVDEIKVVGSRCGPFEPAIRALMRGLVEVQELIDRRFPLEMGLQAFEYAMRDESLKVILEMRTYPAEGLRRPGELEEEPVI
ncbi:MAG: alcohol dehydrogenase catalytic domain-containing protein [Actinobacteria bacterium]|nr:alcohol dehydrogenase catalytic domain-containing protein [Actinomycetota bacterium]